IGFQQGLLLVTSQALPCPAASILPRGFSLPPAGESRQGSPPSRLPALAVALEIGPRPPRPRRRPFIERVAGPKAAVSARLAHRATQERRATFRSQAPRPVRQPCP